MVQQGDNFLPPITGLMRQRPERIYPFKVGPVEASEQFLKAVSNDLQYAYEVMGRVTDRIAINQPATLPEGVNKDAFFRSLHTIQYGFVALSSAYFHSGFIREMIEVGKEWWRIVEAENRAFGTAELLDLWSVCPCEKPGVVIAVCNDSMVIHGKVTIPPGSICDCCGETATCLRYEGCGSFTLYCESDYRQDYNTAPLRVATDELKSEYLRISPSRIDISPEATAKYNDYLNKMRGKNENDR